MTDSSHLAAPSSGRTSADAAPNAPSAHTPGPWTTDKHAGDEWWFGGRNGAEIVIEAGGGSIAVIGASLAAEGRADADARLIAAAPDFYIGAQHLMDYEAAMDAGDHISAMQHYADAVDTLRAAIAKALGTQGGLNGSPGNESPAAK